MNYRRGYIKLGVLVSAVAAVVFTVWGLKDILQAGRWFWRYGPETVPSIIAVCVLGLTGLAVAVVILWIFSRLVRRLAGRLGGRLDGR